jgi:hypothetical protein
MFPITPCLANRKRRRRRRRRINIFCLTKKKSGNIVEIY